MSRCSRLVRSYCRAASKETRTLSEWVIITRYERKFETDIIRTTLRSDRARHSCFGYTGIRVPLL
jgi:hypothetical protein